MRDIVKNCDLLVNLQNAVFSMLLYFWFLGIYLCFKMWNIWPFSILANLHTSRLSSSWRQKTGVLLSWVARVEKNAKFLRKAVPESQMFPDEVAETGCVHIGIVIGERHLLVYNCFVYRETKTDITAQDVMNIVVKIVYPKTSKS